MAFPTTSVLDDFNRANVDPLTGSWTNQVFPGDNDLAIATNQLKRSAGAGNWGSAWWTGSTFGPDSEVFVTWATVANPVELLLRLQTPGTSGVDGYLLDHDGSSTFSVWRIDNGSQTQLGANLTQAVSSGDSIGFSVVGSTLTVWYKAAAGAWTSVGTRTDATYGSAGSIGVVINLTTNRIDDFGGGTVVAGGSTVTFAAAPAGVASIAAAVAETKAFAASPAGQSAIAAALADLRTFAATPAGAASVSQAVALQVAYQAVVAGTATIVTDVRLANAVFAAVAAGRATVVANLDSPAGGLSVVVNERDTFVVVNHYYGA